MKNSADIISNDTSSRDGEQSAGAAFSPEEFGQRCRSGRHSGRQRGFVTDHKRTPQKYDLRGLLAGLENPTCTKS